MEVAHPSLYKATEALVRAVLSALASTGAGPSFTLLPDQSEWERHGQESLYQARKEIWLHPPFLMSTPWWDHMPEMGELRRALEAAGLDDRVDTLVGFEFSATRRDLLQLLILQLVNPLVVVARSYEFDGEVFAQQYEQFERGLMQETGRLVQVLPLLGFVMSNSVDTSFPDGLEIRELTNRELSFAVQTMGVPVESMFGTNSLQVSHSNQFGLVMTHTFPLRFGPIAESRPGPALPSFAEAAAHLVTGLRLVCGGSVSLGRPLQLRHADDFDAHSGYSASRTGVTPPDASRVTVVADQLTFDLAKSVALLLRDASVADDRPLQMALRRIVSAGAPAAPEDRLVDLLIAAEALLIQRPGLPKGGSKREKLADGAVAALAGDPTFAGLDDEVRQLVVCAYMRRNEEMHADAPATQLYRLSGEPTDDLAAVLIDLDRVVRRVALVSLSELKGS